MGNVKCKNVFKHVESNVTIATNEFEQFNCKHLLIVSNLDII